MPENLSKLVFKPGINRDQTNYASEGGWYDCDKIRFRSGYPEKIGGWSVTNFTEFDGVCRSLFPYVGTDASQLIGLGTNNQIYIQYGTSLANITPVRATYTNLTSPSTSNCVGTTDGTKTITITLSSHGANVGNFVTISGVAGTVGGISSNNINGTFKIETVPTANTFTYTSPSSTNASSTTTGGGIGIIVEFKIYPGNESITAGYGWGAGAWDTGVWGRGGDTPIYLPARLVFQERFNDDITFTNALFFNIQDATGSQLNGSGNGTNVYYWNYDSSWNTSAVPLTSASGAIAVPRRVGQILMSPSGHMLALGCTNYDAANSANDYLGNYDPLLIRWSNVDPVNGSEPQVWQPTAVNTAGDLRVKSGSRIICGFRTRQETLIFTDYTINSLQFLNNNEIFGLTELDANISIMGPNAVSAVNNIVYWMGVDKFYQYSGRVDTLPCTIRQFIFQDPGYNESLKNLFFSGTNNQFNEVIWFYASADSLYINRYVIYNYLENIWYYGTLNRTAWSDIGWVINPRAAEDGKIYEQELGVDEREADGTKTAISSYIQSADMDIGDGYQFMLTRKLIPDVNFTNSDLLENPNPNVYMTVGVRNFPGALPVTSNIENQSLQKNVSTTTATIDQYTNQVFLRARGRQINFKISSTDLGVQWQLGAVRLQAREDGRRGGENP